MRTREGKEMFMEITSFSSFVHLLLKGVSAFCPNLVERFLELFDLLKLKLNIRYANYYMPFIHLIIKAI